MSFRATTSPATSVRHRSSVGHRCGKRLPRKRPRRRASSSPTCRPIAAEELAHENGGAFVSVDVTNTEQIEDAVDTAADLGLLRALVNWEGIGRAQRTIGKDWRVRLGEQSARLQEGDRHQPGRHVRLHPARRHRHEPQRFTDTGERGATVNIPASRRSRARSVRPRTRRPRKGRGHHTPPSPGTWQR